MATALPQLYRELTQRAAVNPVIRPDWDQYFNIVVKLVATDRVVLAALVVMWARQHGHDPSAVLHQPVLGRAKPGLTLGIERMHADLQQLVVAFLNQAQVPVVQPQPSA